jgi:hypothetical protein
MLELWILIYELITNYPRLIIKPELIIRKNMFGGVGGRSVRAVNRRCSAAGE